MRPSSLGLSAILFALGCVATETDEQPPDRVRVSAQVGRAGEATADEPDVCSLLPSCGPCSLACDPEKLAEEYVPKGACALFLCTLTDGRAIEVDACNYGDTCTARQRGPDSAGTAHPACASVEMRTAAR